MPRLLALYFAACFLPAASSVAGVAHAASEQVVREQRTVVVDNSTETWRLVWDGKPSTVCGPDKVYMAISCPCAGLAYGEYGKLFLVRSRDGHEVERMDVRQLFGVDDYPDAEKVDGSAYLQRWPPKISDMDREDKGDPT